MLLTIHSLDSKEWAGELPETDPHCQGVVQQCGGFLLHATSLEHRGREGGGGGWQSESEAVLLTMDTFLAAVQAMLGEGTTISCKKKVNAGPPFYCTYTFTPHTMCRLESLQATRLSAAQLKPLSNTGLVSVQCMLYIVVAFHDNYTTGTSTEG